MNSGDRKIVETEAGSVIVANVDGAIYAVNAKCPHLGLPMKKVNRLQDCLHSPRQAEFFSSDCRVLLALKMAFPKSLAIFTTVSFLFKTALARPGVLVSRRHNAYNSCQSEVPDCVLQES